LRPRPGSCSPPFAPTTLQREAGQTGCRRFPCLPGRA